MTTISVTEEVKEQLLKYAGELQMRFGRRVDYSEAIRFLLMHRRDRDPDLLKEATRPTPEAIEASETLRKERGKDEKRTERRLDL
jgi:predicted CopG family antitoxin